MIVSPTLRAVLDAEPETISWFLAFNRLTESTVTFAAVAISDSSSSLGTADSALALASAATSTFAAGCETSCDSLSCVSAEAAESLVSAPFAGFSTSVAVWSAPVVVELSSPVGSASREVTASAMPSAPSAQSCAGVVPKAMAKARNATRPRLATPRAIAPRRRHEARWHSSSNISICLLLSALGALPSGCPTSLRILRSSTPIGVPLPSRAQRIPAACTAATCKMGGDPT